MHTSGVGETITKWLIWLTLRPSGPTVQRSLNDWNSTLRLATRVDPYTLQGKLLPVPLKSIEVLRLKRRQDRNSCVHPTDMQAFVYEGGVINNLVCRRFDQWELRSALIIELIQRRKFLCKVYQPRRWRGSLSVWLAITWTDPKLLFQQS